MYIIDGRNLNFGGMPSIPPAVQRRPRLRRIDPEMPCQIITYFRKVNRGERHEEINVFDAATLKLKARFHIRHAMPWHLPTLWRCALRRTALHPWYKRHSGHLDPASSIAARKNGFAEIQTPDLLWRLSGQGQGPARYRHLVAGDGTIDR